MKTMWILLLTTGCGPRVEVGEIRVDPDDDRVLTSVEVANVGTAPAWVWASPIRLLPPESGTSVLMYDVEPPGPSLIELFALPESLLVPPGDRVVLDYAFGATGPMREPGSACVRVSGEEPCADRLTVNVAWSARPLDREISDAVDPWTGVGELEDGVVVGSWSRPD